MARLELTKYSLVDDGSDILTAIGMYFHKHWRNEPGGKVRGSVPHPHRHKIIVSIEPVGDVADDK